MVVYRCKMCGGTIEFEPGSTVGVCDSCGTKQTLPKTDSEVLSNLFNRANNLRLKCEFDKAEQIYEKIVEQDDSEAEAHWGIVLCKYGIEYVEDPKTFERIPTCHRTLYEPITSDVDYLATIDYSDVSQQVIYEKEARAIDRIQKGILEIVRNEKPFDVFICYKETDENGKRTVDSAIANDIYYQLTQEGLKVFYAPITLEDKVGQEYEPYIFAALNSAKVMLVIGTKPEYFSAVWVKNEWSRFMKLMKTDRSKLLIPCYRDMDAYDLPEEFAHLQAQDMGKIGFINDVVRGIRKVITSDTSKTKALKVESSMVGGNVPIASLLKRVLLSLEDGDWDKADDFCEQILNQDPENAQAYLGKLMVELHVHNKSELRNYEKPFDVSNNYQRAIRFADDALANELKDNVEDIRERNNRAIYEKNKAILNSSKKEEELNKAADELDKIAGFEDAFHLAEECRKKAKAEAKRKKRNAFLIISVSASLILFTVLWFNVIRPAMAYSTAMKLYENEDYESAFDAFERLGSYKDSEKMAKQSAEKLHSEMFVKADVGSIVLFGQYDQGSGKESIEWEVLAREGNRILVLSKKALDCQLYNSSGTNVSWTTCSLRRWLNNSFLNEAFNEAEKEMIPIVTVSADRNPTYDTNPGNSTQDQVFLLSIAELNKYLDSGDSRKCELTDFAIEQGAQHSNIGTCWWMTRTPGGKPNNVAIVKYDGSIDYNGQVVSSRGIAVRPAMWIEINY